MALYINPHGITFGSLQPYLSHLVERCEVRVTTLDEFLSQYRVIRFKLIKMDIEGAELLALQGAQETLKKKFRPVIFYEENEAAYNAFGYTVADLRSFLRELGYRLHLLKPTDVQNVIAFPE